jgi:hypothetical protein
MFVRKEATSSSQIEGTQATIADAIEAAVLPKSAQAPDVYPKKFKNWPKTHD